MKRYNSARSATFGKVYVDEWPDLPVIAATGTRTGLKNCARCQLFLACVTPSQPIGVYECWMSYNRSAKMYCTSANERQVSGSEAKAGDHDAEPSNACSELFHT